MVEPTQPLAGLSPVNGKPLVARFDGGELSSDSGLLVLRQVEERLDIAGRLAVAVADPRTPEKVQHSVADILRFRMLMIAAGYEDGNDAAALRHDPVFKMAVERLPSDRALCSQSTISRMENLPRRGALLRMGATMIDLYCATFRRVPKRIVLDIDDTFDAVHGNQQLRLFNGFHDEYGFQPIVVFDGEGRFITAALRPAKRPKGTEIVQYLRRLVGRIRENWPQVEILLRGDGHYCAPEVLNFCHAQGVDFILGLPPNKALRRHIVELEESTAARFKAGDGRKVRRFKTFYDAAGSWSRAERIIARVEVGPLGRDTRFIVTNLTGGRGKHLYEKVYCGRGQAENHIKAWKTHLAADRTSCSKPAANQLRLFLHGGAYWLMWTLRAALPRRSQWRRAQFDTLRLRLIKIAGRIIELKTRVALHLPTACSAAALLRLALQRVALPAPP